MNIRVTFYVEIIAKNNNWSAVIKAIDKDSETRIQTRIENNNSISDCLSKIEAETKIIMERYTEIYAIKG